MEIGGTTVRIDAFSTRGKYTRHMKEEAREDDLSLTAWVECLKPTLEARCGVWRASVIPVCLWEDGKWGQDSQWRLQASFPGECRVELRELVYKPPLGIFLGASLGVIGAAENAACFYPAFPTPWIPIFLRLCLVPSSVLSFLFLYIPSTQSVLNKCLMYEMISSH